MSPVTGMPFHIDQTHFDAACLKFNLCSAITKQQKTTLSVNHVLMNLWTS